MSRKFRLLLLSHCLAFTVAVTVGGGRRALDASQGGGFRSVETMDAAKASVRGVNEGSRSGEELLAAFLEAGEKPEPDFDSRYRELKAKLAVAKDVKAAAVAAIHKLDRPRFLRPSEQQRWREMAEAEVRALHWMRVDPVGAMEFFLKDDISFRHSIRHHFNRHVFKDIVAETGVLASAAWLSKSPWTTPTFCDAAVAEIKAGGGGGLLDRLVTAMGMDPGQREYLAKISDPGNLFGRPGHTFFGEAAKALGFGERAEVMELAMRQEREADRISLLTGFARSGPDASDWLLEAVWSGELQGVVAERVKAEALAGIRGDPAVDLDRRVAALANFPGNVGRSHEELAAELIGDDLGSVLKGGRDWRYEFRHGEVTVEDVLSGLRAAMPGAGQRADGALREELFRYLVEEDPRRALPLIDTLPEERQRALRFDVLAKGFGGVSPEVFFDYLGSLPPAANPEEIGVRDEGLRSRAGLYVSRLGDDFLKEVQALPASAESGAIKEGVVTETRRTNAAEGAKLEQLVTPAKP